MIVSSQGSRTLFRLFTGALPFTGDQELARALARCHEPPRDPAAIDPATDPTLRAVILRCLERDVSARFQRVIDVSNALSQVMLGRGEPAAVSFSIPPQPGPR